MPSLPQSRTIVSANFLNGRRVGSIEKERLGSGAVDGGVAACGPTGAITEETRVINVADVKAVIGGGALGLSMAFEAKVCVSLHEHLGIDGAVRGVANRAAFV